MKVYLVEVDYSEMYEHSPHIEKAFYTYLDASQYLINEEFDAHHDERENDELYFVLEFEYECIYAKIIEMEVEECL